jgi:hypothetical protein
MIRIPISILLWSAAIVIGLLSTAFIIDVLFCLTEIFIEKCEKIWNYIKGRNNK